MIYRPPISVGDNHIHCQAQALTPTTAKRSVKLTRTYTKPTGLSSGCKVRHSTWFDVENSSPEWRVITNPVHISLQRYELECLELEFP
ncbi:hypothetical protein PISMIDRAFT_687507 [Pisolithus microcarpus 441]|uniref:Uncharacterized protein n=1 Tax=Pisolithus microcarpus 441 TaxID=765257 RepID=A0A0C9YMG5_9AGAM|nr:hypothetical protein PISMIDRAFT_687507 [Pisolithus microcarpus 441]